MGKFCRFEILGEDRLGLTLDILNILSQAHINIVSLEVFTGRLCLMTDTLKSEVKINLITAFLSVAGVTSVQEVELLDYEKNEKRLMAIIDAVDEGVIAVDSNRAVSVFNNYCEELFGQNKDFVLGTDLQKWMGANTPLAHLLETGVEYNHQESVLKGPNGNISYVSTGRVIRGDDGRIIGAVASMKDTHKVLALASIISTETDAVFKEIIGNSAAITRIKQTISTVARSNSTVMLRGDSGTGKELFAHAIHELSGRKGNYVAINCAALPENLLESELFGYEKGSFTGATASGKRGLFSEANHGTLFLDEIGELPLMTQAKLLRVLQEGKIRKIGGQKEELVDVRIVVATNRNLEEMMAQKIFREDLYYRLNVIPIVIPSLASRKEDLPLLVQHFINKLNLKIGKDILGADQRFIQYLMAQPWPGNIRQLQNTIERAMNICAGEVLCIEDLYLETVLSQANCSESGILAPVEVHVNLKEKVRTFEGDIIKETLKMHRSHRAAARALGISHTALLNKLKWVATRME